MVVVVLAMPIVLIGLAVALARRVVVTVGVDEHSGVVEIARHTRRWRVAGPMPGTRRWRPAPPRRRGCPS